MIADDIIICPLSPSLPNPDSSMDDGGWADLESAPIQAEAPRGSAAEQSDDADDVVDAGGDPPRCPEAFPLLLNRQLLKSLSTILRTVLIAHGARIALRGRR